MRASIAWDDGTQRQVQAELDQLARLIGQNEDLGSWQPIPLPDPPSAAPLVRRRLGAVLLWLAILLLITATAALAQSCSGCGCRGGPGYRGPDGRCVGWKDIGKTCGSPPTTRCKAEGPNAGAEEAAAKGAAAREKQGARR